MLALWLPLINNLNNQGLDNAVITNNGATVDASGKIGSCYSFDGGNSFISIDDPNLYNIIQGGNQPFTIMFWVYHADSTRGVIFGDYGLSGSINFNIELTANHQIRFYWDGSQDKIFANTTLEINVWTHIVLTYDGNKICMYKNGLLQADTYADTLIQRTKNSGLFYLGRDSRTGATALNGRINDFRIYSHCLNPVECKKISSALLLHYTLSSAGGENLCVNSNNITTSNFVLTRSTAEGNTITLTPTTSASYAKYKASNLLYSDYKNKTYTLSFYIRRISGENDSYTDKQSNIYIGLNIPSRINNVISSGYDKYVLVDSLTDIPNDWEYHSVTCTVPDDLKSGKNDAIADTSMVTFQFTNAAGGTPVQIKSIKFEIGDKATPWFPNPADDEYSIMGFDDGVEYDVSGYGNNGAKVGDPIWCGDSPRYSGALKFGSGKYIHADQEFYDMLKYTKPTGLTISIWAKMDTWAARSNNQMMVSCQQAGGFAIYVTAYGGFAFQIGTGENKNAYRGLNTNDLFTVSDIGDGWHLFTGTYDGLVAKLYIDGNLINNGTEYTSITPVFYYKGATTIIIGNEAKSSYTAPDANYYFDGYLSDCRLYHTALTSDDVMQLYHAPITLSSNGVLFTQSELLEA